MQYQMEKESSNKWNATALIVSNPVNTDKFFRPVGDQLLCTRDCVCFV